MNGAELALWSAANVGVEVCFANPGTTEMDLVAALDRVEGIRGVLGLFEGVVTGAADGYGRVTGRPALTLTHLGPGFANGIANLHNAKRAHTPVVNLIGDHASWHRDADAPLTADIEALARSVSHHVVTMSSAAKASAAIRGAIAAAMGPARGVASVIIPQDAAWGEAELHDASTLDIASHDVDADVVADAAESLVTAAAAERAGAVGLLVGGVVRATELEAAARIRDATGCAVFVDTFPAVLEAGAGVPHLEQVPYFPEQAIAALEGIDTLVVAGTRAPVAFFGYRSVGRSALLRDDATVIELVPPGARAGAGLASLADAIDAPAPTTAEDSPPTEIPGGDLDVMAMGSLVAALQPEGAIVVNEAATSGLGWALAAPVAPPHEALSLTGGAIGQGLPCAVGAAIAAPDRKVIALQADGSGLYTLQSLWTMAREGLDVTVVVCANRAYRILQMEMHRTGHDDAGPAARAMMDLSDPAPDWVSLAAGFGVEASTATTVDALRAGLERGLAADGPYLVEVLL